VGFILDLLKRLFQPIITPLTKLFNTLKGMFSALVEVIPETIALARLIYSEVLSWRSFRQGINFKSGVINLHSSQEFLQETVDELIAGWRGLVDLFTSGFKLSVKPFQDAVEAGGELADLLESFGKFGLKDWIVKFGEKIEKAGGKILEVIAIAEAVAEQLLKVVRQLNDIVVAVQRVRETLQTGEGLFLQQKNARRIVELQDGGRIKIRVGNLHE
jgi:hypothetical protein